MESEHGYKLVSSIETLPEHHRPFVYWGKGLIAWSKWYSTLNPSQQSYCGEVMKTIHQMLPLPFRQSHIQAAVDAMDLIYQGWFHQFGRPLPGQKEPDQPALSSSTLIKPFSSEESCSTLF